MSEARRTARIVYVWKDVDGPCEMRLELMRREKVSDEVDGGVDGEIRDVMFVQHTYPLEMKGLVERYARDWVEVGVRDEGEFDF